MSDQSDAQVRSLILKVLYEKRREVPTKPLVRASDMITSMDVEQVVLDYHILYLEEKGLIVVKTPANSSWRDARITALGIDHVDSGK